MYYKQLDRIIVLILSLQIQINSLCLLLTSVKYIVKMRNHQGINYYSPKFTKAIEKPLVQRGKITLNASKLRKSIQKIQKSNNFTTFHSPRTRSISSYLQDQRQSQHSSLNKNLERNKNKLTFLQRPFQSARLNNTQQTQSLVRSKWSQSKINFNSVLKRFGEMCSYKTLENNSPRKQKIPGAQAQFDSTRVVSITMSNFGTLEPVLRTSGIKQSKQAKRQMNCSLNLPQIYRTKNQNRQQKARFYEMHPQLLRKQNPKNLERREDKRKNIIALQQLYIRMRNRQTKNIFSKK